MIAKRRNAKADKRTELLRVIHTNICWLFTPPAMGSHKYFITFIDDNSPIMVLSSSFMRSQPLWNLSKLLKLKLSSNKGRRSKLFILIGVISIMVDMMRRDAILNHLRNTFRNVALNSVYNVWYSLIEWDCGEGEFHLS